MIFDIENFEVMLDGGEKMDITLMPHTGSAGSQKKLFYCKEVNRLIETVYT
jgi:hypothetical protein